MPVAEEPFSAYARKVDWRVMMGFLVTLVWFTLVSLYISAQVGWVRIEQVPLDAMGQFLEGAFAPLAFLWFVLAFFSQQKELAQNTAALKMQFIEVQKSADQAVIQSEAIRASELHAKRESFLRIAESVKQQLGGITGFLYMSSQGTNVFAEFGDSRVAQLWSKMGQNDTEVFSRAMLEIIYGHNVNYGYKVLYGTIVRMRHSENFIFNFERLLRAAKQCDEDGMIRDALLGSGHGYLYDKMIELRDTPPPGITYGEFDFDPDSAD